MYILMNMFPHWIESQIHRINKALEIKAGCNEDKRL